MRIGIDCRYLREHPRGVGNYLINILTYFTKLNNNLPISETFEDYFYLYSPGPIRYMPQTENVIIRQSKFPLPGTLWFQTQGKKLIMRDRLHTFWAPCDILPLKLSSKIYKVLSIHDLAHIYFPETMAHYNLFVHKILFFQSLKTADHIITMSNFIKESIILKFNVSPRKITCIYEGVSEKFRPYTKEEVVTVLKRYTIHYPYILAVGTLEPRKNYSVLLEAYKNLNRNYSLVIIGKKGWKSKSIFEKIQTLQVENKVKILGYIENNDLPYLYNGAELFVFPSIYEGFGLPVLEALACGVPTVCSNAASLPEVGGDAVIYFNPNSVDELKFKMQQVLDSISLQRFLKEKSLRQAKKFSWNITAQKTLSILKRSSY